MERDIEVGVIINGPLGIGRAWINATKDEVLDEHFVDKFVVPAGHAAAQQYEDLINARRVRGTDREEGGI